MPCVTGVRNHYGVFTIEIDIVPIGRHPGEGSGRVALPAANRERERRRAQGSLLSVLFALEAEAARTRGGAALGGHGVTAHRIDL